MKPNQYIADLRNGITVHFYSQGGKFNTKVLDKTRKTFMFKGKTVKASSIDELETTSTSFCRVIKLSQLQVWHNSAPMNIPDWQRREFEKKNKRKMTPDEILMKSLDDMASDFGAYRWEIV